MILGNSANLSSSDSDIIAGGISGGLNDSRIISSNATSNNFILKNGSHLIANLYFVGNKKNYFVDI